MREIRWISKGMPEEKVQSFLNEHDFIPESLSIVHFGEYSDFLVTFMLREFLETK